MTWTISDGHSLDAVLARLCEGRLVFALQRREDGQYRCVRADAWDPTQHELGAYRPVEPMKSLLFPPREQVGVWGKIARRTPVAERIVVGVKNCDLSSLAVHDHVFLGGGYTDPYYAEARQKTVLVSCDCTDFRDTCFCPVVGEQPHPTKGFDINVSPTSIGHVLEAGSERGGRLLESVHDLLAPAGDALLEARDVERTALYQRLVQHTDQDCGLTPNAHLQRAVEEAFESSLWEDFAADCVECGACNFICCTCHCFVLADGIDANECPARTKQWDACLFSSFALTAGGGNPRHHRFERLRNRFDKKFVYFPQVLGQYACDGCGRCTDACIGKIDIRKVLKRAVDESDIVHAHAGDH